MLNTALAGTVPSARDMALEARRRLDDITRLVSDWVWEVDRNLNLSYVSHRIEEFLGLLPHQLQGRGFLDLGTFVSEEGKPIEINWRSPFRDLTFETADQDGVVHVFLVSGLPVFNPQSGAFEGVRGTAEDVTERRRSENTLRRLSSAVDQSPALVMITDTTGLIEYINPKFSAVTGYRSDEVIGNPPSLLKSPAMPSDIFRDMWETLTAGREWHGEVENIKKNGESFWVSSSIAPIRGADGGVTHFVASMEDITARKFFEERVLHQNNHDSLTDLPNRSLFIDRLSQTMARARRRGTGAAVLMIDLDRFKHVNDSLGHAAGDELLLETAARLSRFIGSGDTLARLAGDEFAIIFDDLDARDQVAGKVSGILDVLARPFRLGETDVHVYGSIGVAFYPEDAVDQHEMLRNADTALHEAKGLGGNTFRYFTSAMNERAKEVMNLGGQLRHALEREELEVFYQPIADLSSGDIIAAEALIRWRHPELGLISPDRFIPLAEETGLIEPIGEWVLKTVCRQNRAWRDQGLNPIRIEVNISSGQFFRRNRLIDTVMQALDENDLPPESLGLEVTESAFIGDVDEACAILSELDRSGISIAVDDFGTGYSSLSYLKQLPLDTLKIDRSFINDVTTNPESQAIAEAIIAMAHSLKMSIIAEGVESQEQMDFLRARGCQMVQGYFLSVPLPKDDFSIFLMPDTLNETMESSVAMQALQSGTETSAEFLAGR